MEWLLSAALGVLLHWCESGKNISLDEITMFIENMTYNMIVASLAPPLTEMGSAPSGIDKE